MTWKVRFFSQRLEAEIPALPAGFVAGFSRYAERMEIYGPDPGMPHTRAMGQGLIELRSKTAEGMARVFYCTIVDRQIVMLHQFVEKTERTPAKKLAIARGRMKELTNG